ncbi:hypothetical protein [Streptomyces albireticuli]|uniref:ATP-grasp domain-containing protein n=1 Tax=Streptomyces albireticuli TaxID=1940 RepID=A0A2A2D500_9ACTN|nr:hypothetical protein [Streptomyces albireticuli]MCD9194228.1 hypothetical protein [Streptomyces albireticuli]PAU46591.1 hypothetical protein CK936_23360 [Streptomyces albireticuli]
MTSTVLVVDGPREGATDLVVEALAEASVDVFRMDMAQFPGELELRVTHGTGGGDVWLGSLATAYRSVELGDIGAVYWNRPGPFVFPGLSESDAHWARGAARIGFGGVLVSLGARWMNHPGRASAAEFKPWQLAVARSVGLEVPRTLVTNRADEVVRFAEDVGGPLVTKPMGVPYITHAGGSETMYTRVVDLDQLEGVEVTAHLFQEQVRKAFEVRLTCVGGRCLGVRIDAGSDVARGDWRADYDALTYRPISTPPAVAAAVGAYMARMELSYAAFDFIVRPDGRWTFLEANPSGQWAWLDSPTVPIAATIAGTLRGWCSP